MKTSATLTLAQAFQTDELRLADQRMESVGRAQLAIRQADLFLHDIHTESSPMTVRDRLTQIDKNLAIYKVAAGEIRALAKQEEALLRKRKPQKGGQA